MDDLISRQAAIKALEEPRKVSEYWTDEYAVGERMQWEKDVKALNSLPSAQPDLQWIPCSERLPEDGSWNIFTDGKNMSVERYKKDAIDHFFPNGRWFEFDDAIAWMPLPEPYQEEKECHQRT